MSIGAGRTSPRRSPGRRLGPSVPLHATWQGRTHAHGIPSAPDALHAFPRVPTATFSSRSGRESGLVPCASDRRRRSHVDQVSKGLMAPSSTRNHWCEDRKRSTNQPGLPKDQVQSGSRVKGKATRWKHRTNGDVPREGDRRTEEGGVG